ncbi:hypothetical protein F383_35948 [Gossypium arboreum]|uniref:Uncharacterized protein n=1 Tax=Gossypium arboreum TaxID=29729 RepID=A0A0B0NAA5_GOSAR|nr:hypothetical protein F383_35948 [Gossypium arboreum]
MKITYSRLLKDNTDTSS